jgi:SOS response regulatory protein OraA/RecX
MASGPGRVLADGEAQVERYLSSEGFTKDEIEDALDLAAEEGGEYLESDGTWDN